MLTCIELHFVEYTMDPAVKRRCQLNDFHFSDTWGKCDFWQHHAASQNWKGGDKKGKIFSFLAGTQALALNLCNSSQLWNSFLETQKKKKKQWIVKNLTACFQFGEPAVWSDDDCQELSSLQVSKDEDQHFAIFYT